MLKGRNSREEDSSLRQKSPTSQKITTDKLPSMDGLPSTTMTSPPCAGNCVGNPIGELFYSGGPARNYPDRKPQPASEPGGMDYYHIGHITFAQRHTQHQSIRSQTIHGMIVCLTIPPRSDPWKSPSYSPITGFFETTQLIEQSPSTTSLKYSVPKFAWLKSAVPPDPGVVPEYATSVYLP
jgi:hypothetical protein